MRILSVKLSGMCSFVIRHKIAKTVILSLFLSMFCGIALAKTTSSPRLVTTQVDIKAMRVAINQQGRFQQAYLSMKTSLDKQISEPMVVPVPKDGGGGYTHEQHKKNYQLMYHAGIIYQLSQEQKYATYVRDMLLAYAKLYPTLDVHPARKVKSQNPGKLFWQSLNEAVWLVHTIQAYDLILTSLNQSEISIIEAELFTPYVHFLSDGQPSTFDKIHNHGTWATAGVGMAGIVMNKPEWVDKALLGLDKSGNAGFLKQLDMLFSPHGYYNEGPYYQRYALMPFVMFGKAIAVNQPERKIFQHRDGVLLKAILTTIELSYNGKFFPINDAIKSKGIDTIELVHGVAIAYGMTGDKGLLNIAKQQNQILLTGDGLLVAQALDADLAKPYPFSSVAFGDGYDGKQGALVIMRSQLGAEDADHGATVLFKPAAQGLGHGHFDKLTWQFYHQGNEIISDYGAARFLNVEAKYGGRYLPENESYAKQTVAHNTVVVDEISHFNGDVDLGNKNAPILNYFENNQFGTVAQGEINTAYSDVNLVRTLALVNLPELDKNIVLDIFDVIGSKERQLDLPLHYQGQLIDSNFAINANNEKLVPLGKNNGYQHLWLKGQATPAKGLARVTWLNDNGSFYSQTSLVNGQEAFLFTQLGANDPHFNLRNEHGFIRRVNSDKHQFISVLEPHGEYNPSKEYTLSAISQISDITRESVGDITLLKIDIAGLSYLVAINQAEQVQAEQTFHYQDQQFSLNGRLAVYVLNKH